MPLCVAVPKETAPAEQRVAVVPEVAEKLTRLGLDVIVQAGAGATAFYTDRDYTAARIVNSATELFQAADILLSVPAQ